MIKLFCTLTSQKAFSILDVENKIKDPNNFIKSAFPNSSHIPCVHSCLPGYLPPFFQVLTQIRPKNSYPSPAHLTPRPLPTSPLSWVSKILREFIYLLCLLCFPHRHSDLCLVHQYTPRSQTIQAHSRCFNIY